MRLGLGSWKYYDLYVDMGRNDYWVYDYGGDTFDATGSIYIGAREDLNSGRFFHGMIDDVRIYDRHLSDAEINSLYVGGASCP